MYTNSHFIIFPFPLKILAYTYYAFFEWSLIISDLAFDAVCLIDFETFEFRVVDIGMGGKREGNSSALNDLKTYGGSEKSVGAAMGDIKPFEVISFAADVYLGMNATLLIFHTINDAALLFLSAKRTMLKLRSSYIYSYRLCFLVHVDFVAFDDLVLPPLAHGYFGI